MRKTGRITVILRLKVDVNEQLSIYAKENGFTKSDFVEQVLCDALQLKKPIILETRGRKKQKLGEKKMTLKTNIEKKLFKWIFKEKKTSDDYVNAMVEYLEEQKTHAKELEFKDTIEWIDQVILMIQSRNFEKLPIDLPKRGNEEILRYLYMQGLGKEEINIVMGVIEGRIKATRTLKEEVTFTKQ